MNTNTIPAKGIDKAPQFRFAVLSVAKGSSTAELESSWGNEYEARGMFDRQYSKWGIPDTSFYLVDWETQTILQAHGAVQS